MPVSFYGMKRQNKSVLAIVYNAPPFNSGAAKQAFLIFNEIRSKVHIKIISIDTEKYTGHSNFKRLTLGRTLPQKLFSLFILPLKIIWFSRNHQTIHFLGGNKYVYLAMIFLFLLKKKIILKITMNNFDDPKTLIQNPFKKIKKYFFSKIDYWIATTPGMIDPQYRNLIWIPNAIKPIKTKPKTLEKQLNFICVGVICKRKNQIALLNFWETLQQSSIAKNHTLSLTFLGSFKPTYSEFESDYVQRFLDIAQHYQNVHVIGDVATVQPYLESANIYISFSKYEGLSNALLEALINGLYPIVHDANKDTFEPNIYEFGIYFKDFEYNNIIKTLENNLKEQKTNMQTIQKLITSKYSLSTISNQYLEIYSKS